jgi:hypothetical protein
MDGIGPIDPDPEANTHYRYQFVTLAAPGSQSAGSPSAARI